MEDIYIIELVIAAFAFVAVLAVLHRLGFSTNSALLASGVAAGSLEVSFLTHENIMHGIAEVGALFLLFITSASCRYRSLIRRTGEMRWVTYLIVLVTLLVTSILWTIGISWQESIFSAFLLGFTCTPVIINLFNDSSRSRSVLQGPIIAGQIFLVLLLLPLIPVLAGDSPHPAEPFRSYFVGLPLLFIASILAEQWFPETVAHIEQHNSGEVAFVKILALLGLPLMTSYFLALPLAFGAVTSGILVSEASFRRRMLGEVVSLRWLFAALFFVPLGILFDYRMVLDEIALVGGALTGAVLVKLALLLALATLIYQKQARSLQLNIHLLPIGAFSFLLFTQGQTSGLFPGGWEGTGEQLFVTVMVLLFGVYLLGVLVIRSLTSTSGCETKDGCNDGKTEISASLDVPRIQFFKKDEMNTDRGTTQATGRRRGANPGSLMLVQARKSPIFLWTLRVKSESLGAECTVSELTRHPKFTAQLLGLWRTDVHYAIVDPAFRLKPGDILIVSGTSGEYFSSSSLVEGETR